MATAPSSSYSLAFTVVDSPVTALARKVTAHGATPCTPALIYLFSDIATLASLNELVDEIKKAVDTWREKESTIEPLRIGNSPCIMMSSSGAPLAQRVPARPPVLEIANFGLGDSHANVFALNLKDDDSLNTLTQLLKVNVGSIVQSFQQQKSFPSLELVKAPSAEAAEQQQGERQAVRARVEGGWSVEECSGGRGGGAGSGGRAQGEGGRLERDRESRARRRGGRGGGC